MRTATSLTLLAIGAILTFAVTAHPHFLNLQVAGVVIMLVGVAGLVLGQRGYGWLRRRIVLRRGATGPVVGHIDETNYPSSYAEIDPAALQSVQPAPESEPEPGPPTVPDAAAGQREEEWVMTDQSAAEPLVADEYIEE